MYCILGDIQKDISYYHKALEITKNKSLRALNSLGKHYFSKKDFDESLKYYTLAVNLNSMCSVGWESLGFMYMNKK